MTALYWVAVSPAIVMIVVADWAEEACGWYVGKVTELVVRLGARI